MGYIGRPASTGISTAPTRDTFTGDGTTDFTLSRSVKDNNGNFLEVFVSNVQQEPAVTYSVSGTTLTFTTAPSAGEPIYVIFRDYDTFDVGVVPDLSITAAKLSTDAVETAKIKDLNVTAGKLATDAVETAKIKDGEVTAAKFAPGSTVAFPINTANISNDAVTSDKIAPLRNLQEDMLITAAGAQTLNGNVTVNVLENSIRYFTSATTSNICINIRGDDSTTLNSIMNIGNTISSAVIITNGGTAQYVQNTQVDNVLVVPKVQGGSALSSGNDNSTDIYNITVVKTADATFTMFLTQTQFA